MKTIETLATLAEDGTLTAKIPPIISPGERQIVIVIDERVKQTPPKINGLVIEEKAETTTEQPSSAREPLRFSAYPVGLVSEDFTFRREDLYDDDI